MALAAQSSMGMHGHDESVTCFTISRVAMRQHVSGHKHSNDTVLLLLQATLLSLLHPQLVGMLSTGHETQRAINCLHPVLKWVEVQLSA